MREREEPGQPPGLPYRLDSPIQAQAGKKKQKLYMGSNFGSLMSHRIDFKFIFQRCLGVLVG